MIHDPSSSAKLQHRRCHAGHREANRASAGSSQRSQPGSGGDEDDDGDDDDGGDDVDGDDDDGGDDDGDGGDDDGGDDDGDGDDDDGDGDDEDDDEGDDDDGDDDDDCDGDFVLQTIESEREARAQCEQYGKVLAVVIFMFICHLDHVDYDLAQVFYVFPQFAHFDYHVAQEFHDFSSF